VIEGENGFLISHSNPEALAAKIELLLSDPDLASRMGKAGKDRLQRHFSLDQLAESTMRMYQEMLAAQD
jgi:glycosyltransferase involved in cell wall biosynthesis